VKGGLWTLLDEDVAARFKGVKLFLSHEYVCFAGRNANGRKGPVLLHRRILQVDGLKGTIVDHINGDTLDNRMENLRLASHHENSWNSKITSRNTSGFKGVTFSKEKKRFKAEITVNRKTTFIGYFFTAEEAARAYDRRALEIRGKNAALNFSPGVRGQPLAKTTCRMGQFSLVEEPVP
jgi:hypothetical protein